jgi:protein TonB
MALNNKYRLSMAFGLALFFHFMVINMDVTREPATSPDFQIPLSVNIFLGKSSSEPQPIKKLQPMEEPIMAQENAKKEQQNTIIQEARQVQKQAAVQEIKKPLVPIEEIFEPVTREPGIDKTLLEKGTAPVTEDSNIEPDAKEIINSQKEIGSSQKATGALRLARPKYRENNPPVYPKLARKRGYEGTVILQVLVNKQGAVDDLRIETSCDHAMLDRAALNAVRKWLFEPGRRGNEKIAMWVKVPVTFKLN